MDHRFELSLLALQLLGAALALPACGDDGEGGSGAISPSAPTATSSSSGTGGAGGSGGGGGGSADVPVTVAFEARVGDQVFSCAGTWVGLGTAATSVMISDFRLYIHDVRLRRADGTEVPVALDQDGLWQTQNLALLDFEDRTGSCANGTQDTNAKIRGTAPAGDYDGLSFKLGVPFDLNHGDVASAPSPLNLSGLFWSWNGGYKFFRVDSSPVAGGSAFNLHLGSTGCIGGGNGSIASCERPNVAGVVLAGFNPLTTKVLVDYGAVVAGSDLSVNAGGAPGCQSSLDDPDCAAVFERIGIDFSNGSLHPDQQVLFRAE